MFDKITVIGKAMILSHWKLDKGIRQITPYQAKRFAKHLETPFR